MGDSRLDGVQTVIGVASLVPGLNVPASLLNAGISTCRGDYKEAALHGVGVVPGGKVLGMLGKWAKGLRAAAEGERKGSEAARGLQTASHVQPSAAARPAATVEPPTSASHTRTSGEPAPHAPAAREPGRSASEPAVNPEAATAAAAAGRVSHGTMVPSVTREAEVLGTGKVGDFGDIRGKTIEDMVSRVPKEAKRRDLVPSQTVKEGFEYNWKGPDGKARQLRVHGPDSGPHAGPNSQSGWVARYSEGKLQQDGMGNAYKPNAFKNGPNHVPHAANDTHIPVAGNTVLSKATSVQPPLASQAASTAQPPAQVPAAVQPTTESAMTTAARKDP